jgi:hypothetical protein
LAGRQFRSWTDNPESYFEVDEKQALKFIRKYLIDKGEPKQLRYINESQRQLVWEPGGYSKSPYRPYWKVDIRGSTWYVTQEGTILRR